MKAAAITLWIVAFAVLVLASIEGWNLRAIHAQSVALQAEKAALESKLAVRVRNRRPMHPASPIQTGRPSPIPASRSAFEVADPLTWIRTAQLRNVGHATVKAAFESVLWAAKQADVDALTGMISLQERDRKQVESFLAKLPYPSGDAYGTPEHLMALFMAENPPAAVQLYSVDLAVSDHGLVKSLVNMVAITQDAAGLPGYISYTFQYTNGGWIMVSPNIPGGGIQAYLAKIEAADGPEPGPN